MSSSTDYTNEGRTGNKKAPTEARISDEGGKKCRVREAGYNSHPSSMIYNRRDKLMQEKRESPH